MSVIPHDNIELFSFIIKRLNWDDKHFALLEIDLTQVKNMKLMSLILLYLASNLENYNTDVKDYLNKHLPYLEPRSFRYGEKLTIPN